MLKRTFDIIASFIGIIICLPFLIIISLFIVIDSKGGVFYKQNRVGRNNQDFILFKFRTMKSNAELKGLITIGEKDSRITRVGLFLRKFKLDELPQLLNVFIGDMSIVGPRPEVRKYVEMYDYKQMKVLSVRPGLTDYSSIEYINENEILGKVENPEEVYINEIMPAKLNLNLKYIEEKSFSTDLKIIFKTLGKIFS
ncbi:MAG: sugar transferase [Saprospiraceae bacterium]|nr:sugar transferase [Saprospiraceae bacterium]